MSGRLDLTPWARAAIPDQAALRQRVPDGHTLHVSTSNQRAYHVSLTTPGAGLIAKASGPIDWALDDVLVPVSYLRCAACGKRLDDYGDCDACSDDESEAQRAR